MRPIICGLMLATAGLALAAPASAATVVYQGKCQQLCELQQVNGNVTNVSYFFNYSGYQSFGLLGIEAEGAPVYQATGTFNVSGAAPVDYSFLVTASIFSGDATFYYDYPISQNLTGNLSYYQGQGSFEIGATTWPKLTYVSGRGVDLANQRGGRPFDSDYRIVITYDEVPAVPEPATWALMLAGFGMIGSAMRRRRVGFAAAA